MSINYSTPMRYLKALNEEKIDVGAEIESYSQDAKKLVKSIQKVIF